MNIFKKFFDMLVESLTDNKKLIIVMTIIFFACFIGAWIFSSGPLSSSIAQIQNMSSPYPEINQGTSPVDLFITNEFGGIFTYVCSIFFGIFAVVSLVYNGVNLGLFGQLFSQLIPNGGIRYIVYLIPHGIFELSATILQSAAGIMLFMFIWRFARALLNSEIHGVSEAFEKTKKVLIQSLIIMIFSTILLLIAAPIEAYISVPFSELLVGT